MNKREKKTSQLLPVSLSKSRLCRAMSISFKKADGFTLVEVMVALLIVAVAISSLLFQMMSTVDNTAYLRDKTIAHWVALNQLELIYLENRHTKQLLRRERSGEETMGTRQWYWTAKPLAMGNDTEGFQQIQVAVRSNENDESSLVSVTGLIDIYHVPK